MGYQKLVDACLWKGGERDCNFRLPPRVQATRFEPGQISVASCEGMSVTNIDPDVCVIANGNFAFRNASCGVTPHAQNTGISSSSMMGESPSSGLSTSAIPITDGSPR